MVNNALSPELKPVVIGHAVIGDKLCCYVNRLVNYQWPDGDPLLNRPDSQHPSAPSNQGAYYDWRIIAAISGAK
jgi:hypothetical protein